MRDPDTKLWNKRKWNQDQKDAEESGKAVAAIDADALKWINDNMSHSAGTKALRQIANEIESIGGSATAYRTGGDEFIVLMPNITSGAAELKAEGIRHAISDLRPPNAESDLRVTASMGGAMIQPGEPLTAAFERADADVYRSKAAGRDRLHWLGQISHDDPSRPRRESAR